MNEERQTGTEYFHPVVQSAHADSRHGGKLHLGQVVHRADALDVQAVEEVASCWGVQKRTHYNYNCLVVRVRSGWNENHDNKWQPII